MFELVSNRLFQIKNLIYHYANRRLVDESTIENAIYHKSIQNSLYADFKQILEISSYIIRYNNQLEYKVNNKFSGLIFDVSLVWEAYLYKLLKDNFKNEEWQVIHEEPLEVYKDKFYERNMYPDIVIKNKTSKKILVFDAKSKSMTFTGRNQYGAGDLDRNDFFQINTYMSYYQNSGYEVIAGGLLYPMKGNFENTNTYSESWFGNDKTRFIVDGLDLLNLNDKNIIEIEQKFIGRIKTLTTQT
jgi:5-methylcytosine-specific restriction endonuclease McrBC regulatory subunit McrC